jgi:hypothetical protein
MNNGKLIIIIKWGLKGSLKRKRLNVFIAKNLKKLKVN